jgi:hypothetical protein
VQFILHLGAKKRDTAVAIVDPESLLQWLGADRASVRFRDVDHVDAKRAAFSAVIRQWIEHVQA